MISAKHFTVAVLAVACCSSAKSQLIGPPLWGLAYSPFRANQDPNVVAGSQPTAAQIAGDVPGILPLTTRIRTYTVSGSQSRIPALVKPFGITVYLGSYLGPDQTANATELQGLVATGKATNVTALIVGNETLSNANGTPPLTPSQLIADIKYVKARTTKPVIFADTPADILAHPEVAAVASILMPNIHPYWDKVSIANATQDVLSWYRQIQNKYPGKPIIIGETGWPSEGAPNGAAVPSPAYERKFLLDFINLAKTDNIQYFFFEGWDERFKSESNVGPHWGLYNEDGSQKLALQGVIAPVTPDPDRLAAASQVLVGGKLGVGLDIDVDSSLHNHGWLSQSGDSLLMSYPAGEQWGDVAVIARPDSTPRLERGILDVSRFHSLDVELRTDTGPESVYVGLKSWTDLDNGLEPRVLVKGITSQWQTFHLSMFDFFNALYPTARFDVLHVMPEFVFIGAKAHKVYVRNISFSMPPGNLAPFLVDSGTTLGGGLNMGIDESLHNTYDWLHALSGYFEMDFPGGQSWAVTYIYVDSPMGQKKAIDLSMYHTMVVVMKGAVGGEEVSLGMKSNTDADGQEPLVTETLTNAWKTFEIPLNQFQSDGMNRLSHTYLPCEFVSLLPIAQTVYFRSVSLK